MWRLDYNYIIITKYEQKMNQETKDYIERVEKRINEYIKIQYSKEFEPEHKIKKFVRVGIIDTFNKVKEVLQEEITQTSSSTSKESLK